MQDSAKAALMAAAKLDAALGDMHVPNHVAVNALFYALKVALLQMYYGSTSRSDLVDDLAEIIEESGTKLMLDLDKCIADNGGPTYKMRLN